MCVSGATVARGEGSVGGGVGSGVPSRPRLVEDEERGEEP